MSYSKIISSQSVINVQKKNEENKRSQRREKIEPYVCFFKTRISQDIRTKRHKERQREKATVCLARRTKREREKKVDNNSKKKKKERDDHAHAHTHTSKNGTRDEVREK
jgi:hypothetical protein